MVRYQEFEHTADVGVEIYGKTLEELFKNAGYALFEMMVDTTTIIPNITRTVQLSGTDTEMLLMNWLRELLYLFSVYQEVYAEFEIQLPSGVQTSVCTLEAQIKGESLDLDAHAFRKEIKAVTYHQFAVTNENGLWKARVILDV
jgi:SHS2 domain-containing protein